MKAIASYGDKLLLVPDGVETVDETTPGRVFDVRQGFLHPWTSALTVVRRSGWTPAAIGPGRISEMVEGVERRDGVMEGFENAIDLPE